METKVTVRTKITVNGKEYKSVDDLPPQLREAYRKAMETAPKLSSSTHIVIDGQQYESPDAMPPHVRALYDAAMSTMEHGGQGPIVTKRSVAWGSIEPASGNPRWLVPVSVCCALLALLLWIASR